MITILIPTMNRPDFLTRLIRYYADLNFSHSISIGDASDSHHAQETKRLVERLEGKLNIAYQPCFGLSIAQTVAKLNQAVTTPYATLIADDDFLVPKGVEACVDFLEKKSEYTAAHGAGILFTLKESGAYGDMVASSEYKLPVICETAASQRLRQYLKNYSVVLFSIHRSDVWKKMWEVASTIADTSFSAELLPSCLSAVLGKTAEIDCLYLIRQGHDRRYLLADSYDWLTSPKWQEGYETFDQALARALAEIDGASPERAHEVVKEAFWAYLNNCFQKKFKKRYQKTKDSARLKSMVESVPFGDCARSLWRRSRGFISDNGSSLTDLIKPSSPYYSDFRTIYDLVTKKGF